MPLRNRLLFGHPIQLYVVFSTEMWERFSFVGMRALLILYLTHPLRFTDREAASIYGAYNSLNYMTPLLGGLIADRWLGMRRSLIAGSVLIFLGHLGLGFGDFFAPAYGTNARVSFDRQLLFACLSLIITGTGFFKTNISAMVGKLYLPNDPRRDAGFSIYYMGTNLGGLLATVLCGWLAMRFGWNYGFGAAAIGMAIGLTIYLSAQPLLRGLSEPPGRTRLKSTTSIGITVKTLICLGIPVVITGAWFLVQNSFLTTGLFGVVTLFALGGFLFYAIMRCKPVERDRLIAVLILTAFSVVFWTLFDQAGSSLNLFAERNVNLRVGAFQMPVAWTQSLNPIFIILLAPIFSRLWTRLAARGQDPSTPNKFALGLVQVALGFWVLVFGAQHVGADGRVALIWLAAAYLLHTTGELCLSPIGLSRITSLAPGTIASFVVGIWYFSLAAAHQLAAVVAGHAAITQTQNNASSSLGVYVGVFAQVALAGLCAALALWMLGPLIRRLMHGIR